MFFFFFFTLVLLSCVRFEEGDPNYVNQVSPVWELVSKRGYSWWRINAGQEEDQ